MKRYSLALAISLAIHAGAGYSQTFTTLVDFTGSSGTATGSVPVGSLTLVGTSLYAATSYGGDLYGNVFSVGINGTNYRNLVSFTGSGGPANGAYPRGSLTLVGASLYGMTLGYGGGVSLGNVFSVGTNGTNYQNVLSFTGTGGSASGQFPWGSLTLIGTALYGMTSDGGAGGFGNVFSVGTNGSNYQNVLSFTGSATGGTANGEYPMGSLTLVGTRLYGMTSEGGAGGYGNVFSVGSNGTNYQNLVSFTPGGTANGDGPEGSLTLVGTRLYGMTSGGAGFGNVFSVGTDGTGYQNLISFTGTGGTASGENPVGDLTLVGATLYGTTIQGGANFRGNLFSVGLDGSDYRDLYDFTGGVDGGNPSGELLSSGGTLFGMAGDYGVGDNGTIFAYTLPAPTPEPCTLTIAGSAAAVLCGAYRWRRSRRRRVP